MALVDELQGPRPVKAVQLLGQNLVLFRDERAARPARPRLPASRRRPRLRPARERRLALRLPRLAVRRPRQVPGDAGRAEGPQLCPRIRQRSYPVVEKSGILFAYLGEGEPPAFPEFDCFVAPDSHTFAFKGHMDCNWLQALEVGIDPAHASYLHRFFEDEDTSTAYGKQFRGASAGSDMPMTKVLREYDRPRSVSSTPTTACG